MYIMIIDTGNRNKAIKILEKGQQLTAQPAELLQTAFSNLVYGRSQLVTDEEERLVRCMWFELESYKGYDINICSKFILSTWY